MNHWTLEEVTRVAIALWVLTWLAVVGVAVVVLVIEAVAA